MLVGGTGVGEAMRERAEREGEGAPPGHGLNASSQLGPPKDRPRQGPSLQRTRRFIPVSVFFVSKLDVVTKVMI